MVPILRMTAEVVLKNGNVAESFTAMPYLRRLFRKALQHSNDLDFEFLLKLLSRFVQDAMSAKSHLDRFGHDPAENFFGNAKDMLQMQCEDLENIEALQPCLNEFDYEAFWEDCLAHQDQIYVERYEGGSGVDGLAWGTPRTHCERWLLGCALKADGWVLRQILTDRFFTSMEGL
jgi:hypothetical protein